MSQSVYKISVPNHQRIATRLATECRRSYDALQNKDSGYARDIKALAELHERVAKIWRDAPREVKADDTATVCADCGHGLSLCAALRCWGFVNGRTAKGETQPKGDQT